MQNVTPCGVVSQQAAYFWVVLGKPEQGPGGVGGLGRKLAGTDEYESVGGALSGAPGLVGGISHVSRGQTLEGCGMHASGIGEYGSGVG